MERFAEHALLVAHPELEEGLNRSGKTPEAVLGGTRGKNLAGLYSLVATCEANDVNPVEYLADVLGRLNDHPHSRLDELLPHDWCGPPGTVAVESKAS